jgi:uncharacterized protein (TIGR02265 family)
MVETAQGCVKGGVLQARLKFVSEQGGPGAAERVVARLPADDQKVCAHLLAGSWYDFGINDRLDHAIAAEMGAGDKIFLKIGETSATHNLGSSHRVFINDRDPHGLLKRASQIYQLYYNTGNRTYESLGDHKAVLRTFDSKTFSKADCLTVVGWHAKAIEMCGGKNVRVVETLCRARGDAHCEYVCEWQ